MLNLESLKHVEDTEILVVYNMTDEAIEILGADQYNPHPFDDNGAPPDGPAWYIPLDEISDEVVDQIEACQLGGRASAHVFVDYDGSEEQKQELNYFFPGRWCGYTLREVAYARDANE